MTFEIAGGRHRPVCRVAARVENTIQAKLGVSELIFTLAKSFVFGPNCCVVVAGTGSLVRPNFRFDGTARSHSFAAAGRQERY